MQGSGVSLQLLIYKLLDALELRLMAKQYWDLTH